MSTVATAFLPLVATLLPELLGHDFSLRLVQVAFVLVAAHVLLVAGAVVADWRGVIGQLRAIARVQRRRWPWCSPVYVIYRDSRRWWRLAMLLSLAPAGLLCIAFAIWIGR